MRKRERFAVITPYYKESAQVLSRCLQSVRGQSIKADHFLIADGFPQNWLDGEAVRHNGLDSAHGDYGNFARGVGAMLAASEAYEGIGFLDADNWFDATHVEQCVARGKEQNEPVDLVFARRRYVRPDGTPIPVADDANHIDTNCFWFLPGAFYLLKYWATMPKAVTCFGDRIFYRLVRERNLATLSLKDVTVNYLCLWESVYRAAGETPPPGAKPNLQLDIAGWYRSLTDSERKAAVKRCGTDIFAALGLGK